MFVGSGVPTSGPHGIGAYDFGGCCRPNHVLSLCDWDKNWHTTVNIWCSFACQIPRWSVHHVTLRGDILQNWPNCKIWGSYAHLSFTDWGKISRARVNVWCALPCQFSAWSVYAKYHVLPNCEFWGLIYISRSAYPGQILHTKQLWVLLFLHCVHEKNGLPKHVLKSSKLASFAQLQFSSMNICLFSIKMSTLVKICPTVIEILTFNKWS